MLFRRTTISCVGAVFAAALLCGRVVAADLTFPLAVKWSVRLPAPPLFAPAFDRDHAYLSLRTGQLVAVRLADGATAWSVACPTTSAPAAGDDLAFTGGDGQIQGHARNDGRVLWRRPVQGRITSLHWDTGWLLASTEAGPLLALRAADGEVLWQRDLPASLQTAPAVAGDRVYLPLTDGRLVAISLHTGEDIWTYQMAGAAVGILPVGDRVFVGALDNQLHALGATDASVKWKWRTGADLLGQPVLDQRLVYFVALDNVLRGHSRNNGTMSWKRVLPMRPFTGPILSGQTLIVSGVASELRAYRAFDGSPAGEFNLKGTENEEILLAAPPHYVSPNLLILVSKGGQIRALGSASAADAAPPPSAQPAPSTDTQGTSDTLDTTPPVP